MGKDIKILIVDDEKNLTITLVDYLSTKYHCDGVFTVGEAIDYLEKSRYDLVLSDMKLPDKDGFDLLTWLNENAPDVKFILMTAYGSPALKRKVKEHGALFYIEKPIDLAQLERVIEKVLKQKGFEATVRDLQLEDILRFISFYEKDVVLRLLNREGERGFIGVLGDKIIWARTDKKKGISALKDMLTWKGGIFNTGDYYELQGGRIEERIDSVLRKLEKGDYDDFIEEDISVLDIEFDIVDDDSEQLNPSGNEEGGDFFEKKDEKVDEIEKESFSEKGDSRNESFKDKNDIKKGGETMVMRGATSLEALMEKFKSEVRGFVLTALADYENGISLASVSETVDFDAETASAVYAEVIKQCQQSANFMGGEEHLGDLEDILITHEDVYILLKMVGEKHFQILALSTDKGNLGLAKIIMRNYEPFFLETLKEIGEL